MIENPHEPTPRLRYEGDVHPATDQRVFRQELGWLPRRAAHDSAEDAEAPEPRRQ